MADVAGIAFKGFFGVAGFIAGRFYEKRDNRGKVINDKISNLTSEITGLSDAATKYYINPMDERNTSAQTALIGSKLKRINVELHSLCKIAKTDTADFLGVVSNFHHAVTAEPFGERNITPIDAGNDRILEIQNAEEAFIRQLKDLERS